MGLLVVPRILSFNSLFLNFPLESAEQPTYTVSRNPRHEPEIQFQGCLCSHSRSYESFQTSYVIIRHHQTSAFK